jgi:translocation and assembly module TamB
MSESPSASSRRRPRWINVLVGIFAGAVLILVAGSAAIWWMYTTSSGLRFVVLLNSRLNTSLIVRDVSGSLRDGFTAGSLSVTGPTWSMNAADVAVEPNELRWRQRVFDFERVTARSVAIDWVPSGEPAAAPASLASPIDLRVRNLNVAELRFGARGDTPSMVGNIAADVRLNADEILVERAAFQHGPSRITLSGRIDARSPFAVRAQAQVASTLREHGVTVQLSASATLLDAFVEINADSADARVQATARLTPFAPVPLAQLNADIAHFNPAAWFDGAPMMRLRGSTDLKPVAAAAGLSVDGPFSIENLDAGPIDKQRVPVRSARGSVTWSADTLTLALQRVEGIRGGAAGDLTWSAAGGVNAKLTLSGIDASTIYSTAAPTRIGGTLNYAWVNQTQRFAGALRTDGAVAVGKNTRLELAADFNLLLRDQVLNVETARLRIADGRAELAGRVELHGSYAARIKGTFDSLDLARLVKGFDTRLNGSIELDARFRPTIAGRAEIALSDSRLMGRALDGRAAVALADQRIDVDVNVASRSARLTARGGLGSGRELTFELVAPQLAEIVPGTSGSVTVRGTASGEFSAPQLRLDATANDLKFANGQTVDSMTASIAGGTAATAPLAIMVKITGHRAPDPDASLSSATLVARGVTSDHTLELNGTTLSQQPLRVVATGGWRAGAAQDYAWRGSLITAESGKPLELRLSEPASLTIAPGSVSFGPARFVARGTQFSTVEVQQHDGRWRTSGTFDGLRPQALDASTSVGAARRLVRTGGGTREPLTLRGRWELELATTLTGVIIVERTGGDIYGGIDALHPIGIRDLGLALSVLNDRVTGTAYVRGKALGRLDAVIDAYIDTSGAVQIARNRPFRIEVDAVLPDLSWMGPLIGDSVQIEGSGSIKTAISGTPADPTASGAIRASGLRIAYVEQGVRLEDGTLDANLEDGVLVVNELVFTGAPRVAPDDKRAAEAISFETPGRLRTVARIALRTLTGSVGIQAERLPVLQRRDRWMVVSGEGGITLVPKRADLYAKLRVDGAYIDFSRLLGVRSLPNDVVVVRAQEEPKADAAPVDVTLDVRGNLGSRFYIRGAGLEARLDGALDISGRPGHLLAEGNVRTRAGTYQGYGQRLQIERGILTFQGPVENPALNVLAVRTGLPVEVGVSIGGTAARPIVRLHSDPSMPDVEKLNWLVLGRPPGAAGDDRAVLSAAAGALFAGEIDSASTSVMRSLGIDEVSLRPGQDSSSILPRETVAGTLRSATGTTAASDFVALGKRLNDDLYLTFEQAISGAATYVALNYQISRRLSLITRAGTTTALDLVYSIAFD